MHDVNVFIFLKRSFRSESDGKKTFFKNGRFQNERSSLKTIINDDPSLTKRGNYH